MIRNALSFVIRLLRISFVKDYLLMWSFGVSEIVSHWRSIISLFVDFFGEDLGEMILTGEN